MTATRKKYGGNHVSNNSVTRSKRSNILSKNLLRSSRKSPSPNISRSPSKSHSKSIRFNVNSVSKKTVDDVTPKKPYIFLIAGLWCESRVSMIRDHIKKTRDIEESDIEIICNIENPYINIVKTACYFRPLNNNTMLDELAEKILASADERGDIYVYGTSFGGMITNRIAEILTKKYDDLIDPNKKSKLYDSIKKIHFSTFGSIYISQNIPEWIDIINYIAIGDVANTCTRGIKHKQSVSDKKIKNKYNPLMYGFRTKKLYYKQRPKSSPRIVDICLCEKENDKFVIKCNKTISNIPIVRYSNEWDVHGSYNDLIYDMMQYKTTYIDTLYKQFKKEEELEKELEEEEFEEE